ncbi:hypothetical protein GYB59_02240 [bacterium]|nr:hypothetical protein [bacterium]
MSKEIARAYRGLIEDAGRKQIEGLLAEIQETLDRGRLTDAEFRSLRVKWTAKRKALAEPPRKQPSLFSDMEG